MKENFINPIRNLVKEKSGRVVASYLLEGRSKLAKLKPPSDLEELFSSYYNKNYWRDKESISGGGSTIEGTKVLREKLEKLFTKYNIKSMADIPCGDYNWMQYVKKTDVDYIGADIVPEMIEKDNNLYKDDHTNFIKLDITKNEIPKVDLILVRDCFVHLSYENIINALNQIKQSESKYLLTTSFMKWPRNFDIPDGMWRPINLEKSPFKMDKPLEILVEESEKSDTFSDKSLFLYSIDEMNIPSLK